MKGSSRGSDVNRSFLEHHRYATSFTDLVAQSEIIMWEDAETGERRWLGRSERVTKKSSAGLLRGLFILITANIGKALSNGQRGRLSLIHMQVSGIRRSIALGTASRVAQ